MTRSEGGSPSPGSAQSPWKKLAWLPGVFAVCRFPPDVPVPAFPGRSSLYSVTRTDLELSIVCEEASAPEGAARESGWRALRLEGPIPFSLTGVLASLSAPLARAGLPIFVVSTYDTDYLLVRDSDAEAARAALEGDGFLLDS